MSNMLSLDSIKFDASPNFSSRGGKSPELIILHCPVGTMQGAVATFKNPLTKVSAHYVVGRDASIVQMVKLEDAAWHAMHYPNMVGIGIEMVDRYLIANSLTRGCMGDPNWFTKPELDAVASLVASLMHKFNIPLSKVIGHNDPYLKQFGNNHVDPGPYFPWFVFKGLVQAQLPVQIAPAITVTQEVIDTNSPGDITAGLPIKRKAGRPRKVPSSNV